MFVLGLQGSPRKKGNTRYLLSELMNALEKRGAETHVVDADKADVKPCKEYIVCEKKGFCPIEDEMEEIYGLLRRADLVVLASPVFFYNVTAQLKSLIDRSQTLWARRYRLDLTDPGAKTRKGFMLALGATKGKNLFEGMHLTARYFFDAVAAQYEGALTYWQIEKPGDMEKYPTVLDEVEDAVEGLMRPFQNRKRVLFACRENACRSQMAGAFARSLAGEKFDVQIGGSEPAEKINKVMVDAMQEKKIDMGFITPRSIDAAVEKTTPEIIVTMGCGENACPHVPGAKRLDWDLEDPAGKDMDFMRKVRDDIEKRVTALIASES